MRCWDILRSQSVTSGRPARAWELRCNLETGLGIRTSMLCRFHFGSGLVRTGRCRSVLTRHLRMGVCMWGAPSHRSPGGAHAGCLAGPQPGSSSGRSLRRDPDGGRGSPYDAPPAANARTDTGALLCTCASRGVRGGSLRGPAWCDEMAGRRRGACPAGRRRARVQCSVRGPRALTARWMRRVERTGGRLEQVARERARRLLQAHSRVRRTTREGKLIGEPQLPADVLGTCVLMPLPRG